MFQIMIVATTNQPCFSSSIAVGLDYKRNRTNDQIACVIEGEVDWWPRMGANESQGRISEGQPEMMVTFRLTVARRMDR